MQRCEETSTRPDFMSGSLKQQTAGEPAIFDKDVRVPSVKLSKRGLPPTLVIESDRFEVK